MDNSKGAEGDWTVIITFFSLWGKRKKQKKRGGRVWLHLQRVDCEDWGEVRTEVRC